MPHKLILPGAQGAAGAAGATGPQGPAGTVSSNFLSYLNGTIAPLILYYLTNPGNGNTETNHGSSGATDNATWHGSATDFGRSLVIGDTNHAALFDGSTSYLDLPTGSLPTGAGVWTIGCILQPGAYPPSTPARGWELGTDGTAAQAIALDWTTANLQLDAQNAQATSPIQDLVVCPALLIATYDGTQFACYLGGNQVMFPSAYALNLTYGHARLGASSAATPLAFASMVMQYWWLKKSVITAAQRLTLAATLAGN